MSGADDPMSDAEKIRLRRLARLGHTPTATTPPPTESTSLDKATTAKEGPLSTPAPQKPSSATAKPAVKPKESPQTPVQPAASTSTPKPRPAVSPQPKVDVPYPQWEAERVTRVFSVTLSELEASGSDRRLCWLKDLSIELQEEGVDHPTVSMDIADRLLIARLSMDIEAMAHADDPDKLAIIAGLPQNETIFEYLIGCWKRLNRSNREAGHLSENDRPRWLESYEKLRSLIISYTAMTLEDPTMFPQPADRPTGPAEFLPILLNLSPVHAVTDFTPTPTILSSSELVPFLNDLASTAADSLSDVITPTLSLFFQEWFKISPSPDLLGDQWQRYLGVMVTLVRVKGIATILPSLPIWVAPSVTAPMIEWQSLLGPLLRLSVYPREFPEIWKTYFSNPTDRKTADIDANKSNLRFTLRALQDDLFNVCNAIVRASPQARESILNFLALVVNSNAKRAGMRVDPRSVASDGFMTNILIIALRLLEPAMDIQFSKIDKIGMDQCRYKVSLEDETRIHATKDEVDEFMKQREENASESSTNPFISELFYLTAALQHLGLVKTLGTRLRGEKNISEMERELKRTEASRGDWAGNPTMEAQGEAAVTKLKNDIATLHATMHAYDTQLLEPTHSRLNITFCAFTMTWLLRLVDPKHQYPSGSLSLPLPAEAPMQFRVLPEYFIENITEYFDFLMRYDPECLEEPDKEVLITFALAFLSPGYVNNPFLKAKLVSIISSGLYPAGHHRKGVLYDRLTINSMSTQYLMPTVIRFFIEVENTGGHTQFWDKFNFRRDMSHIFRSLWDNPLFRTSFIQSRHDDFDQFIKFINMLMSDTTFHLEESLTNLSKINAIQSQQADQAGWNALPEDERRDLSSQMQQAESQAPFHTVMGLDHIELIRDFTATTKEPFVTPEIVDRLVASLDENLVNLVGPKMQELRVPNPDRFSFKPKRLLAGIAQIYLNLAQEGDFVRAVANDGRSYSKELFERFARILKHRAIMTEMEVGEVVAFTQKVENMKATIAIEDEREIPDEFLDPLLSTLMKDPVILPVSRVVVDRGTIRTVLLSKEVDPFNNVPLKYEDCIPDVDLKAKIDAWIAAGKTSQSDDVMDVDKL